MFEAVVYFSFEYGPFSCFSIDATIRASMRHVSSSVVSASRSYTPSSTQSASSTVG
ncbi:MAG: hypothetical protein BWY66_01297 [bacterium ADurb.Bin374]|nr:MAG: hypothetical protein BWY66_01297 [bacterium ADurb.Bin374]